MDKSASELHQESTDRAKTIKAVADTMRLRQWAVDQAVKSGGEDIQKLTEFFYEFVTR